MRVKRSDRGFLRDPLILSPRSTVGDADDLMRTRKVGGLPVVDESGQLVGLASVRDVKWAVNRDAPITAVMTPMPLHTAPPGTTLEDARAIMARHKVEKLPIVNDDGTLAGLYTFRDVRLAKDFPQASRDEDGRLRVAAAIGTGDGEARADALAEAGVDCFVVDSAHGMHEDVLRVTRRVVDRYGIPVIHGNVATYDGARMAVDAGASAIKVGLGPGSICTTRLVSGVGLPQFYAIQESARAAADADVPIIADGGIRYPGDLTKALAGGAEMVMIGSLLAGTDEAPGDRIVIEGQVFKAYYGMGSYRAMSESAGARERYLQEGARKLVAEGVEARVPYRGPVGGVLDELLGGLRAGMGYAGAPDLPSLRRDARFIRQTSSGLVESAPHDVIVTREGT
jgi:IMP dehydrogenase